MKLAVISDIHEDIVSLELALRKIEKLSCNEIACLGDIVGFSIPHYKHLNTRNANKCIELISKYCKYAVVGNHDHYALKKIPQNNPYTDIPSNWYKKTFDERKTIAQNRVWLYEDNELSALLNSNSIEWLDKLPELKVVSFNGINILLSHFIFPDITGFTTYYMQHIQQFCLHHDFIKSHNTNFSFFGHIHTPKMLIIKENNSTTYTNKYSINIESIGIGIPPIVRNKTKSGFVVFDTSINKLEVIYL